MLKYQISLLNVFWSENDINTRYFESVNEQKNYFDNLVRGGYSPLLNFNMNDNCETVVTYRDQSGRDIEELLKTNYAIVRRVDEEDNEVSRRYYFAYSVQDSGNQVRTVLNLDDIQTNYFTNKDNIASCLINKAHLNRWIENEDNTISFNLSKDSILFEREEFQGLAKRLVKRSKMLIVSEKNPQIANFINENIACWCYILLDEGTYKVGGYGTDNTIVDRNLYKTIFTENIESIGSLQTPKCSFQSPCACLCYPIYKNKNSNIMMIKDRISLKTYPLWADGFFTQFIPENGGFTSKIKTVKLSLKPPFDLETYVYDYEFFNNNLLLTFEQYGFSNETVLKSTNTFVIQTPTTISSTNHPMGAMFNVRYEGLNSFVKMKIDDFNLPILNFNKNEIVGAEKNSSFNPKLNGIDYKTLTISLVGSTFDFDISKINSENPIFKYKEFITPDTTKMLLTLYSDNENDIYNEYFSNSFSGLIATNDLSLPLANEVFDEYLANNKNAYVSFQNQQNYNIAKGAIGTLSSTIGSLASGNLGGAISGVVSGGVSMSMEYNYNKVQFGLTMDDMRSSPDKLVNANGSVIFGYGICEFGIYANLYEGLPVELNVANDFMQEFGYTYNQFGKIKDFDNIRKYYNFISADVHTITSNLSNKEKERLIQRFRDGVRFWNIDNVDYEMENYERWLEDE